MEERGNKKGIQDVLEKKGIIPRTLTINLQHVTTALFKHGKSSSQQLLDNLREKSGIWKITELDLRDYLLALKEIGLVKFDIRTASYFLTQEGSDCYQ